MLVIIPSAPLAVNEGTERRTDPTANEGGHAFIRQIPAKPFIIDIVVSHGFLSIVQGFLINKRSGILL